jgi:hypothetical protein
MKQLDLNLHGLTARLTLRSANVGDNLRRSMLAAQALQDPLPDPAAQTAAVVIYPRCLACLVEGTLSRETGSGETLSTNARELTPAEFVELPGELGEAWLSAALELNPTWNLSLPDPAQLASAEKKG